MATRISGPGLPLQVNQNLYPSELYGAPVDVGTNYIDLAAGDALPIPAGEWFVDPGGVSVLQYLDPTTGIWRTFNPLGRTPQQIFSDGFTRRIANLTGCPVSAVVAGGGTGFAQSTATITANVGGSTWQAVVGGALSVSTISAVGANYTMPPIVLIPAPPSPGIAATARATIANGTVSAVTLTNVGAGYISAPTAVLVPNPTDPAYGSITPASIKLVLNAALSGAICGALCTNQGAALATLSAITLTAAGGGGSGATITPVVMQTLIGASVAVAGGGYTGGAILQAFGGQPASVSAIGNPSVELTGYRSRPANAVLVATAGALTSLGTIYDGGLFVGTPIATVTPESGVVPTTTASVTLTMGSAFDTVLLQSV